MRELPPLEYEEPKLRERKSQLERIRNDFSGSPDISMYRTSSAIRSLEATLSREPAYPYEKLLESALREISGVREEAEKNLNMLLLKAGKIDEALSVAKDSANLNWGANKLLLRTALAYLVKGKNREAADIVGKLYAKRKWGEQPEHWDVSEAHGNGWMVLSDVRHELDMIEYAIVITDLAGMEKEHGNILLSVGRAMSAEVKESIAREYMMEPFDTPRHLVRLAIIYHEAGADAKAREHLSRAFSEAARQSSNEAQYLLFEMASLQLDFGFREDALKTIGAINPPQDWNSYSGFSSDPSFDEVSDCRISAYARLVARAGLFEEADKLASRIPTYYKPRIDVLAKAGIAVLKFKAGKEKEALRRLKRFPLLSARKNPRALMGFALAQAQVGLTKKAKSSFAKAASVIRKEKSEVRRARLLAYLGVKQAEAGFLPDSDASFGAMENTLTSDDITSVVSPNYLFSAYLSAAKGIESAKSA
jgi:tetratricopeptide (TPR) repeat protein